MTRPTSFKFLLSKLNICISDEMMKTLKLENWKDLSTKNLRPLTITSRPSAALCQTTKCRCQAGRSASFVALFSCLFIWGEFIHINLSGVLHLPVSTESTPGKGYEQPWPCDCCVVWAIQRSGPWQHGGIQSFVSIDIPLTLPFPTFRYI